MDVSAGSISIDVEWNELKEPICNGFDNGNFWFKFKLEASEDNIDYCGIDRGKNPCEDESDY